MGAPYYVVYEDPSLPGEPLVEGPFAARADALRAALEWIGDSFEEFVEEFEGWTGAEGSEAHLESSLRAYDDWRRGPDETRVTIAESAAGRR